MARSGVCGLAVTPDGGTVVIGHSGLVTIWRSVLHTLVATPAGKLAPAAIQRCRATDGTRPAERAWLDLAAALSDWRHRHDIDITDAHTLRAPTDIELGDT